MARVFDPSFLIERANMWVYPASGKTKRPPHGSLMVILFSLPVPLSSGKTKRPPHGSLRSSSLPALPSKPLGFRVGRGGGVPPPLRPCPEAQRGALRTQHNHGCATAGAA
jgi:hypothetical protein